ncbi:MULTISPECIES: sensor histidine kinase [Niastella]|uniref:Histidine kinase n=1 Tax=Niastella soli TaxID=2821487 RepID=A0ABS3Z327_9BACT|nr:sensor histidine kinase [Niastella soli]MBO9204576.1 histidine kinase [Niastella soli]
MKCRLLTVLYLLVGPLFMYSQEFSYSRYDSRDGLAGSTVYCMTQDPDGILWFGTETGLTRFDGTHYRNFTLEDGLPDNEIIQLFADSKGRVWISPFRKAVVYYYKGKIHTSENDSLLKKLQVQDNIVRYAEDEAGNILLQEISKLHLITPKGEVFTFTTNNGKPLWYISLIASRKEGGFWVLQENNLLILQHNQFTFYKAIEFKIKHFNYAAFSNETLMVKPNEKELSVWALKENRIMNFPYNFTSKHINFDLIEGRYVVTCTREGAWVYNMDRPDSVLHHLPGITVSNVFKDKAGNWWFCTLGNGVYRLNSDVVRNIHFNGGKLQDHQVESILQHKNWMLTATNLGQLYKLKTETGKLEGRVAFTFTTPAPNPLLIKGTLGDDRVYVATKHYLIKLTDDLSNYTHLLNHISVKALCTYGKTFLVATEKNVLQVDQESLKILDTVWQDRATSILTDNDTIYIGALNGLYQLSPGKKALYLGAGMRALSGRISALNKDSNQVLWVATAGDGLVAWKNGRLIKHLTRNDGLSSNICRRLFYENGKLWVGTEKGLNKVRVLLPGYPIEKYTTSDGLSSDLINAVCVSNKKVFVGTPEGVTFFDEEKIASQSRCDLRVIDITIGNETYHPADAPVLIPHAKNNIQFNYVGISYKSGGDIRYRYRLLGLDSTWHDTRETGLNYPTLPSGDYQLQLQAINKFDVSSAIVTTGFTIEKLLYEETWFKVLISLLFLAVTGVIVLLIIRRIKKREQEKTATSKRISELEQLSRKAQMNPHFIFNSLNSIQQYVMDADVAGANKFISGFSRLIRQTLDFSSKPEISLEEELDYLTNYLEIEKTRLENAFSWVVNIDKAVDPSACFIPPMILQPFVENSVRHGLRFRKDKNGVVTITVKHDGDHLVCILEDNGIGRKAAMQYKSVSPINYQSKGLSLTADRIAMFNQEHAVKILMWIDDLEDNFHNSLGTRVTIYFPVL